MEGALEKEVFCVCVHVIAFSKDTSRTKMKKELPTIC